MIEWLLWLLFLLFFGISSSMTSSLSPGRPIEPITPTPTPAEEMMRLYNQIETVEVLILESFPMQLQLQVTGINATGCDYPAQVEQSIEGTTINVHIFVDMPLAVMCPAVIIPYEATIPIEGSFTGGVYTINVNNVTTQVDFGGEAPTATPMGVPSGANLIVETVEAINQSAAPATTIVHITGYFEDACDLPILTSQSRDGNNINIYLSREIPPNVRCAAGPTPFSIDVTIEELLMEGTYILTVNDVVITFSVA